MSQENQNNSPNSACGDCPAKQFECPARCKVTDTHREPADVVNELMTDHGLSEEVANLIADEITHWLLSLKAYLGSRAWMMGQSMVKWDWASAIRVAKSVPPEELSLALPASMMGGPVTEFVLEGGEVINLSDFMNINDNRGPTDDRVREYAEGKGSVQTFLSDLFSGMTLDGMNLGTLTEGMANFDNDTEH